MHVLAWCRLCTAFQKSSDNLCNAVASVARRLCTSYIEPSDLSAYTAYCLIALDKNPGVRPIGVGEVLCRIIGNAILGVIFPDIQAITGTLQLCTGQEAGVEAALQAINTLYNNESTTEAALLVDASNAFNSLNRQVALHHFLHLCLALATVAINTYRQDINLFIDGECIPSKEGVTQGDPLGMAICTVTVVPLIRELENSDRSHHQIWFANDAAATGSFVDALLK